MICASESPPQSLPAVDENVDDLARMRGRRRYDQIGPAPGGNAASVPIPKFAYTPGTLSCELRNQRDTSKSMILVPLLNPKFAIGLPPRLCELRVRGTSVCVRSPMWTLVCETELPEYSISSWMPIRDMYIIDKSVKNDPVRRWALPDRVFFACGACHI